MHKDDFRSRIAESFHDNSVSYTFDNKAEAAQAIFVHGNHEGVEYVTGSLNWGAAGRHFKLEMCSNHALCYTWSEVDTANWVREGEFNGTLIGPSKLDSNQKLLDLGKADKTSNVFVSITVYTDSTFRSSFESDAELVAFVNLAISETNQGYANSQIPIVMFLKCLLNTPSEDGATFTDVFNNFVNAANNDFHTFRRASDVTVLLTNSFTDACGVAYFDVLAGGQTLGAVTKGCATGYYTFGHEIAHMVGALHNREAGSVNIPYPTAYGFLMRPPVNSGYRTILAYPDEGYITRINHYSNPAISFFNIPTGELDSNNAQVMTERRFIMAGVGDESLAC
jgi:hypothetical protein